MSASILVHLTARMLTNRASIMTLGGEDSGALTLISRCSAMFVLERWVGFSAALYRTVPNQCSIKLHYFIIDFIAEIISIITFVFCACSKAKIKSGTFLHLLKSEPFLSRPKSDHFVSNKPMFC